MREGNPVDAGTPDTKRAAARWWWALSAIALVALVVRITFVLVWENPSPLAATRSSDAFYYHTVANFVADGRGFIYPFFLTPDAQHPPAYTLLLAGASILGFRTVLAHQIVSCLLGAVFVGVVGITGREIGGARVGLVAAALAAVYPGFWINDGLLMSESLAQLMVAIVLLLTYRALRVPTVARILLVGLACGLAALTRGELILLVPFAAVPLLVSARRRFGVHTLTLGVGVLVVVGATILPWSAYNLGRFDRPVLTSTQLGQTIAGANCPLTYDDPDWMGLWNSGCVGFYEPLSRERRAHPDASVGDGEYRSAAFRFVRAHPQRAAVAAVARTGRVLGVYRPFQQITFEARPPDSRPFGPAVAALVAYFVTFAAAIGGVVILRRGGVAVWPFLSISAMTVVAATATYGATRFRVPLEVALLVPAAALITSRFAPRRRR